MREIILERGLTEELKWRQPCYTHDGRIIQPMKAFVALLFFKGALTGRAFTTDRRFHDLSAPAGARFVHGELTRQCDRD